MRARVGVGRIAAWALLALVACAGAIGCGKSASSVKPDGGGGADGSVVDVRPDSDVRADTPPAEAGTDVPPCITGTKALGMACSCGGECSSGFCAEGVCCNVACTEGCKTCTSSSSPGTCVMRATG